MDISEIKVKVTEFETLIIKLIYDLEKEANISITDLDVRRGFTYGDRKSFVIGVEAKVELW